MFRTDVGLAPGYTLAPPREPGTHELARPLLLLSGDEMHTVSRVTVHEAASLVILSSPRGWATIPDIMNSGYSLYCRRGGDARTVPSSVKLDDLQVQEAAVMAAVHMACVPLDVLNRLINRLGLHEVRTRALTPEEFRAGRRVRLDFTAMTENQYMLFVYTVIATMHRLNKLAVYNDGGFKRVRFRMGPIFWRDIVLMLLNIYCFEPVVRFTNEDMNAQFGAMDFLRFVNRAIDRGVNPKYRDFRLLVKAAAKVGVVVDDSGYAHIVAEPVDKTFEPTIESVPFKLHPFTGRAISFPEVEPGTMLEHNSMVVKAC